MKIFSRMGWMGGLVLSTLAAQVWGAENGEYLYECRLASPQGAVDFYAKKTVRSFPSRVLKDDCSVTVLLDHGKKTQPKITLGSYAIEPSREEEYPAADRVTFRTTISGLESVSFSDSRAQIQLGDAKLVKANYSLTCQRSTSSSSASQSGGSQSGSHSRVPQN